MKKTQPLRRLEVTQSPPVYSISTESFTSSVRFSTLYASLLCIPPLLQLLWIRGPNPNFPLTFMFSLQKITSYLRAVLSL